MENLYVFAVVPHAGTWIEILRKRRKSRTNPSFPTRERGLKLQDMDLLELPVDVVPHAGTWIEIHHQKSIYYFLRSFPTRERGLK